MGIDNYWLSDNTETMQSRSRPTGRPCKLPGDKYETHTLKFPPDLWQELVELVPPGERSAVIHRALERELKRRRRLAAKAATVAAATPAEQDPWQQAAAAAKDYYETDPGAVEWAMFAGDTLDEEG